MKVMLATAYKGLEAFSPYIRSMVETVKLLTLAGIEIQYVDRCGDAYVDRAKNWLVRTFIGSSCDQLFLIDSDMSWEVDGIVKLLSYPEVDVVGGTYRMKNNWENYCGASFCHADNTPVIDPQTGLIYAQMIPGGFMKLTKRAVGRMYQAYEYLAYKENDKTVVPIFQTCTNSVYVGEDTTFCKRWTAIRGKLWIEPRLTLVHWGTQAFPGNFHEFMLRQPGGANDPEKQKGD